LKNNSTKNSKYIFSALNLCILFVLITAAYVGAQNPTPAIQTSDTPFSWASTPPADCPFLQSENFKSIEFTGKYRNYTNADTWYPSWAEDDALYSPWTDGYILDPQHYETFNYEHPGFACNSLDYMGRKAATAQARIIGDNPLDLTIENIPPRIEGSPLPYGGRYPCGSLIYNGVWYYGTYCLTNNPKNSCNGVGWTEFGPFVGFRYSIDYGKHWSECPHTPENPLFAENPLDAKIRIGAPHFVDFGRNMKHSPDGCAYLIAHGSTDREACNNWIQADNVYLIRVKPSIATINDSSAYQFYAGQKGLGPIWSDNFADIKPLVSWPGHLGCVTMSYNAPLKKYLMCITRGKSSQTGDTMILESKELSGPWAIVHYLSNFGPFAYFVNIPTKFISKGGYSFWLSYSANFSRKNRPGNPPGSHYSLSLHEVRLIQK